MNETRTLAEFVSGLTFKQLPEKVVEQAGRIVLDTIGCAVSAWKEDSKKCKIAADFAGEFEAKAQATVFGADLKSTPALAAMANAIMSNAADNDDTHKRALIHTGSIVVPVALAMAEANHLTGAEFLTALVAGYEVAVRVGMAVMPTHYKFWHSTATNGTFGAAATAAKGFKLNADETQFALGFAGTQAAGLNTFFEYGDYTKSFHPGKAAFNGIISAQFARLGATSPPTMLENEKGYVRAFSDEPKLGVLTRGVGEDWEILQNGFKYYPSILASHSPVGATLKLVTENNIFADQIAKITNETYNTVKSHFSNKDPRSEMAARVSVPYCIAVAAVDKKLGQAQFSEKKINDPLVREVLSKTEVIAVPELNALYPEKFPARVTITLKDGSMFQETVHYPKGDPANPLKPEELEKKFLENVEGILNSQESNEMMGAINELSKAASVDRIVKLLSAKRF